VTDSVELRTTLNQDVPGGRTGGCMSNSTALITEMGVLVGIFLLGLLAKLFPRNRHKAKQ
jgi:hypothetical protein